MDENWIPPSAQPRGAAPARNRLSRKNKRDDYGATPELPRRATKIARRDSPPIDHHPAVARNSNRDEADAAASKAPSLSARRSAPTPEGDAPQRPTTPLQRPTAITVQRNGAALPRHAPFDPYRANSRGHQAGDGAARSVAWRGRRQDRLAAQFGEGGIVGCFARARAQAERRGSSGRGEEGGALAGGDSGSAAGAPGATAGGPPALLFRNVVVYVDGSTLPLVSDHQLRRLVVQHGGGVSGHLARRAVTHVVLTHKSSPPSIAARLPRCLEPPLPTGCADDAPPLELDESMTARAALVERSAAGEPFRAAGGGLAAGKMQKEITTQRGAGIKFVTTSWILESIKAGRRLPEWQFADWNIAHERQLGVSKYFGVGKLSTHDENKSQVLKKSPNEFGRSMESHE